MTQDPRLRVPRIAAFEFGPNWLVWCLYCDRWHAHGHGEGHRGAHCDTDSGSPFQNTGYYIFRAGCLDKYPDAGRKRSHRGLWPLPDNLSVRIHRLDTHTDRMRAMTQQLRDLADDDATPLTEQYPKS